MKQSASVSLFIILFLISCAATALVYFQLPEEVATRWGQEGEVISTGPRFTLVLTALLPLLTLWLIRRSPSVNPAGDGEVKHRKAYMLVIALFLFFLMGVHWLIILFNLGVIIRSDTIVKIVIGAVLIVIGRQLPRITYGESIGIRTPWSVYSSRNWEKTHRFGEKLFYLAGAGFLAISPLPGRSSFWIGTALILAAALLLYYYSYSLAKKSGEL